MRLPRASATTILLMFLMAMVAEPAAAATTRTLTITTASAQPRDPFQAFDGVPGKVFDFNRDGKMEIVAQNDNRHVYVLDSQTGALRADLTTTYPAGWGARSINGPEASVLVRGGARHIVVANSAAYVTDFVYGGYNSTSGAMRFTKLWERRLTDCHGNPGMDAKPVFADLDLDTKHEILVQTEEVGVYALRRDGSVMWKQCIGGGNGEPGVGDVDNDGWPDVVWCSDGGVCTAMDGRTGTIKWSFWVGDPVYDLGSASMPVGPTVAQLDGAGGADVLVGARDSHDCTTYANNHAALFAISGSGQLLWMRQPPDAPPLTHTHPIVHDVDDDGQQDVLWATWNTMGHLCGNWESVGVARAYRYDAAGNLRWTQALDAWWHNKDIALADVDGDGVQEVLANGGSGAADGVWYLDSRTGAREAFVSAWPWKLTRGPVVEDLWAANTTQWVVQVHAHAPGTSGGAIQVYDTAAPYDAAWPHLPYPQP